MAPGALGEAVKVLGARQRVERRSVDSMKRPVPSGVADEMEELVEGKAGAIGETGLLDLIFGGLEGPVDEERPPDDIAARNKAPVTAVEAIGAIVSHDEVVAGRDEEVFALDV